jgi:hypothetical protein
LLVETAGSHVTGSLAERTREAAREEPFLVEALAAELVNYTAAARYLADAVGGDPEEEAVATALSRFAEDVTRTTADRDARVSMESGVGLVERPEEALLAVGDCGIVPGEGTHTALVADGDLDPGALGAVLSRLSTAGIDPIAAGTAEGTLVVVVSRLEGADALRVVEDGLDSVPTVDAG